MATRRDLFDPADPADLQPEQRLTEVAAILAAGVIHMRERRVATAPNVRPCRNGRGTDESAMRRTAASTSKISPESGEIRLELSDERSPDGQCG
ncbi:MAG: hypothetical protein HOP29_07415 [Phycisphaerales bacterium]|nr:hypothetical protein [Phycisphaerales bacterium]